MINAFSMFLYNHSPIWMQNALCTLAGRRYLAMRHGGEFDTWAHFYGEARAWSLTQLQAYQQEQLTALIRECFDNVVWYGRTWRAQGLNPGDIRGIDDLPKLPYTTKEDVFTAGEEMLNTRYDRRQLVIGLTGGSTGMPLARYFTKDELQRHYAIFWDRMRPGVKRGDRYATFQGKEIVPPSQKRPPYWRENRAANQRLYSMRFLSPENLQQYAQSLIDEPFVYYQGYVSFMTVVAEYMDQQGLRLVEPPKAVFATSEQLSAYSRALFERVWGTRAWDEYCQGERCALICECEHGNRHAQMDYGVIEYEPIGREGRYLVAEIICTGFIPQAAPLIRYRIGDRVLIDENVTCPCGAPGPVIKGIQGRQGEYIITPDGRTYPHISLIVDMLRNVRRTQVVQEKPDGILVRVLPFPQYTPDDERHLSRCFQDRIGGGIQVQVQQVADLERLPNGKVLSIINRISGRQRRPEQ